jgi:hypothetical protein
MSLYLFLSARLSYHYSTAHTLRGLAVRSDKRYLSHKIRTSCKSWKYYHANPLGVCEWWITEDEEGSGRDLFYGMIPVSPWSNLQLEKHHFNIILSCRCMYPKWSLDRHSTTANERGGGGGKPVQIIRARTRLSCICFCLSRLYHYLLTVQINRFRPNPSQIATESQFFWFSVKIFSRSTLAGGPEKIIHRGPNTLSEALHSVNENILWFFLCHTWSLCESVTGPTLSQIHSCHTFTHLFLWD